MNAFTDSEETLTSFLQDFEGGRLPRERWTHAAHIAAGTVFTRRYGADVLPYMRAAIKRHNASVGTPESAYHETLTVFWLAMIAQALLALGDTDDFAAVLHTTWLFGEQRRLHERYYSFDVVASAEARAEWVKPDLQLLPVSFLELGVDS